MFLYPKNISLFIAITLSTITSHKSKPTEKSWIQSLTHWKFLLHTLTPKCDTLQVTWYYIPIVTHRTSLHPTSTDSLNSMHCRYMAKGSNLISLYQVMVRPLVPFRTSESLRIFCMGYITMYTVHMVVPQCIIDCISTLLYNFQISFLSLMTNFLVM